MEEVGGGGGRGDTQLHPWDRDAGLYEESRILGVGAYGTVVEARNRQTGDIVAMKKIAVPISDDGIPQSLIREIASLKSLEHLRHNNIAWLLDVIHGIKNENEMYVHLIFEKGDWDLYYFLTQIRENLPAEQIRLYAQQLLQGLDFLHSNNIIHRDLKPQNILINKNGTAKITDFGLARTYSNLTLFTTVVVTLWYRSPELLLQCSYATPVDIWSLGCIFAELYLRRALLPGQTEREQLDKTFQVIGLPNSTLWPHDSRVVRESFPEHSGIPFSHLIPNLTPPAAQVLEATLNFVPTQRLTATQLLKLPFFAFPVPPHFAVAGR